MVFAVSSQEDLKRYLGRKTALPSSGDVKARPGQVLLICFSPWLHPEPFGGSRAGRRDALRTGHRCVAGSRHLAEHRLWDSRCQGFATSTLPLLQEMNCKIFYKQ